MNKYNGGDDMCPKYGSKYRCKRYLKQRDLITNYGESKLNKTVRDLKELLEYAEARLSYLRIKEAMEVKQSEDEE